MKKYLILFGPILFLCSCANLQNMKLAESPKQLKNRDIQITLERPSAEVISIKSYEVPNRSVYLKQTGGGSAALGLLFGPLGALASGANINRLTQEMGKSGQSSTLYQLDAIEVAKTALSSDSSTQPSTTSDPHKINLKPYLILYVDNNRTGIYTVAGFRAETFITSADGSQKMWAGHYNYALEKILSIDSLSTQLSDEEILSYINEIKNGYKEIYNELKTDMDEPHNQNRKVALVWAPILKSTLMGFAGCSSGDVELKSTEKMSLRVNMQNYGPAMDKSTPYFLWTFPSAKQYRFDDPPMARK